MSLAFEGIEVPIRAIDEATEVFRKVSDEAQRSLGQVETSVRTVEEAHERLNVNFRQAVTGFSGVATAAFNLYNAYDRVQDMQLSVSRANLQVQSSLKSLEDAQKKVADSTEELNKLQVGSVELYNRLDELMRDYIATCKAEGEESKNAIALKKSLEQMGKEYESTLKRINDLTEKIPSLQKDAELAQERYNIAVERAQVVQGNLNEVMVQSALSVIPTVITMVDNLNRLRQSHIFTLAAEKLGITGLTAAEIAHTVAAKASAAAQAVLNAVMNANPILLVVTALGALTAALIYAYETCEPFRAAVDSLGTTLMSVLQPAFDTIVGGLTWLWNNVLIPFGEAFKQVWNVITNNPILAVLLGPVTTIAHLFQNWENATKSLGDALKWFMDNIVSPLGNLLKPLTDGFGTLTSWFGSLFNNASAAANQVSELRSEFEGLYGVVGHPPSTGLIESFESLDKIMRSIEVPEVEASLAGASAAVPAAAFAPVASPSIRLEVNAPLVNVEGSADRETAQLAARMVEEKLRNVLVEASSSAAPATHRRIRSGGLINVA